MTISTGVNSLIGVTRTTAPTTVSASVSADGASVDATTSQTTGNTVDPLVTTKSTGLQKDDFLNLLMTELQNQDPLSPMDNSQMMTQMAQLEAIESSNNMQQTLQDLDTSFKGTVTAQQSSAQSMVNATAVSLIGKNVTVKQDSVDWSGDPSQSQSIRINLGNNASATCQILDDKGNVVKTLQTSGKDAQNSSMVTWDGSSDAGGYVAAGTYTINVVGQDKDTSLYAFVSDTVQGVRFDSTGAKLEIGGKELTVANVMDVTPDDQQTGFNSISPSSAVALLGKTVRVSQPTITYNGEDNENAQIKVNVGPSAAVQVSLTDSSGETVATLSGTADANGIATIFWNGQTISGAIAGAGQYTVNVKGSDTNPSLYSFDEGTIDGISTTDGTTQLRMNGQTIALSRIIDISSAS
jgi:flagellar basal-body rod modification protein FlgD